MKKRFSLIFLTFVILAVMLIFLFNSKKYIGVAYEGIKLWAIYVLPCLFPFFVFSKLLVLLNCLDGVTKFFSPMSIFYRTNKHFGYVFFISLISGYPVGVKTACELAQNGLLSKSECESICTLTNFVGSAFAIGTVGSFFGDTQKGVLIFVSCVLGALLNGIFYRTKKVCSFSKNNLPIKNVHCNDIFNNCIYSSIESILSVGGTVAIFFLLSNMIVDAVPFCPRFLTIIFTGLLEMTSGVLATTKIYNGLLAVLIACAFISFGGLCVFVQCCIFWEKVQISPLKMLLRKTTQAVVSVAICALFYIFI